MKVYLSGRAIRNETGGNSTYARELCSRLPAVGIKIDVLPSSSNPIKNLLLENVIPIRVEEPGSVIHFTADTGPLHKLFRAPVVTTVHGVASLHVDTGRTRTQELVWRSRVRAAIHNSHHIITVSETSKNDLIELFQIPPEKISYIYHGISDSYFHQKDDEASNKVLMSVLGDYHRPFALYVGNLEPRKNLESLIDAFHNPEVERFGIPLVIAGKTAWGADEIIRKINGATNVIYLGRVSEEVKVALMQRTTLFTFPSLYEGFGFPVLEALASGARVISSSGGSLGEIAGPALRFNGLDAETIASDIAAALSDESWSAAVGIGWASKFSWNDSIESHKRVYQQIIGGQN